MPDLSANIRALTGHLPAIRRWSGRGFWAVIDQALFAGANFVVNILLARWLLPEAYGAFATAFAVFLLLGTLHTALWTEPMLVYGSGKYRASGRAYQRHLLDDHWRFAVGVVVFFIALAAAFHTLGQPALTRSCLGLTVAAPLVLYLWLVRKAAYVILQPRLAAQAAVLYLSLFLSIVFLLRRFALLDEFTALASMGLVAWLSGWLVLRAVKVRSEQAELLDQHDVRVTHWRYGRWALVAGGLSWVPTQLYYLLLPTFHGLNASASFKAHMNLLMPILHFNAAIAALFVPMLVRSAARSLVRTIAPLLAIQLLPATLFAAILWFVGVRIANWLYAEMYPIDRALLLLLGLSGIFGGIVNALVSVFRAKERPDIVARIFALNAIAVTIFGAVLIFEQGVAGAVLSVLIINVLSAALFSRALRRLF